MFISFILLGTCVFFFILRLKCHRPKNFPPGPFPLPILGNVLNLNLDNPIRDFERLYDSVPIIRNLPLPFMTAFKNNEKCTHLVTGLVTEHKETRVPGQPRDFLDCYLDELDEGGDNVSSFCEARLIRFALDLHFAATDTTSNTLLTGFLYLTTYPHVQERCQQEIDRVLENKDHASYDDRHNMPYMQAVIHEVQRTCSAAIYLLSEPTHHTHFMMMNAGTFVGLRTPPPNATEPRVNLAKHSALQMKEVFLLCTCQ
ncbi:hypothetical protein VZT92_014495 [Zoarces viviparus]|uniref:Cytochrome P450 n=1 Tax=Zoarces viviparus TaxID=48416 RepID=A0AAW1EZX1_ZOAVI